MRPNSIDTFVELFHHLSRNSKGCVLWSRALSRDGYGNYKITNQREIAHRLSYKVFKGSIPIGDCVLHRCDNPACINPDHLFLGTRDINNKDRMMKGRSALGEQSGRAKLTEKQVQQIYALYHTRKYTTIQLGKRFGVSTHQISMIGLKQTWRHLL